MGQRDGKGPHQLSGALAQRRDERDESLDTGALKVVLSR